APPAPTAPPLPPRAVEPPVDPPVPPAPPRPVLPPVPALPPLPPVPVLPPAPPVPVGLPMLQSVGPGAVSALPWRQVGVRVPPLVYVTWIVADELLIAMLVMVRLPAGSVYVCPTVSPASFSPLCPVVAGFMSSRYV